MISSSGRLSLKRFLVRLFTSVDDSLQTPRFHDAIGILGIGLSMSMDDECASWKVRDNGVGLCEAREDDQLAVEEAGEKSDDRLRFIAMAFFFLVERWRK